MKEGERVQVLLQRAEGNVRVRRFLRQIFVAEKNVEEREKYSTRVSSHEKEKCAVPRCPFPSKLVGWQEARAAFVSERPLALLFLAFLFSDCRRAGTEASRLRPQKPDRKGPCDGVRESGSDGNKEGPFAGALPFPSPLPFDDPDLSFFPSFYTPRQKTTKDEKKRASGDSLYPYICSATWSRGRGGA